MARNEPYERLPVVDGILHGETRPYDPAGWLTDATDTVENVWILAQDDTGARYWRLYAVRPLATV